MYYIIRMRVSPSRSKDHTDTYECIVETRGQEEIQKLRNHPAFISMQEVTTKVEGLANIVWTVEEALSNVRQQTK